MPEERPPFRFLTHLEFKELSQEQKMVYLAQAIEKLVQDFDDKPHHKASNEEPNKKPA